MWTYAKDTYNPCRIEDTYVNPLKRINVTSLDIGMSKKTTTNKVVNDFLHIISEGNFITKNK